MRRTRRPNPVTSWTSTRSPTRGRTSATRRSGRQARTCSARFAARASILRVARRDRRLPAGLQRQPGQARRWHRDLPGRHRPDDLQQRSARNGRRQRHRPQDPTRSLTHPLEGRRLVTSRPARRSSTLARDQAPLPSSRRVGWVYLARVRACARGKWWAFATSGRDQAPPRLAHRGGGCPYPTLPRVCARYEDGRPRIAAVRAGRIVLRVTTESGRRFVVRERRVASLVYRALSCCVLSLRHPPARLLAIICLSMAVRARRLVGSPCRNEMVLAVLLVCPAVMIPSGSGTMPPS